LWYYKYKLRGKEIELVKAFISLPFCMLRERIFIEEKFYKVWLSLIENLGFKRYTILINKFKTNKNIFYASENDLMNTKLINDKLLNNILNIETKNKVKKYLEYMQKNNIDIISINDIEYPSYLREIYAPPIFLYIRGNKEILSKTNISIVGCRDCSNYGKEMAQKLAYNLAKNNINIVSGLARGIDEYSHLGAIFAHAKTIAVLACGVDYIYPKENTYLVNKILNLGGAIISEYPVGSLPQRNNFPARNRIISGLSQGVVVVEAKKKSGSLITADFALEQGRDVFVVPRKH